MKKLLYGLGALLLLLLLALVILTQVVDTERVKRLLIEQTREKTGRTLVINGDLSWRFFPSIGFTLKDTALLNPPGFAAGNTLSAGEISLDVGLKPLFDNRLEIGEAVLANARLHLITRADGVSNIDDLRSLPTTTSTTSGSNPPAETDAGGEPAADQARQPMSISLAGVRVVDAEIVVQNEANNTLTRLNRVNVKLDEFAPGKAVPLSLSGNLFSDEVQANMDATGQLWLAPELDRLRLDDLKFDLDATGRSIPGTKQLRLEGNLAYELDRKLAEFTDITLKLGSLDATGELSVRHSAIPELRFNLNTALLDVDALQAEWRTTSVAAPGDDQAVSAAASASTLPSASAADEPDLSALKGIKVKG
ncbi:MAG: AsmA family protein, partial [Oceanisphaera sp.]|nr:AsmA family protein [Oceanisphaera sp.]